MNTTLNDEMLTMLDSYRNESKMLLEKKEGNIWIFLVDDEREILNKFGLPNSRRYYNMLRSFGSTAKDDISALDKVVCDLKVAARNYLLRPVLTPDARLELAKRNNENPYDVLPELDFTTHHFNIFLYSYLFLSDYASAKEILNDLRLARDHEELPFIFNLSLLPNYRDEPEYRLFRMAGFKFIDAYCNQKLFIPEPLNVEYENVEDHHARFFKLTNLLLTSIVFDNETPPTLFCDWQRFGKSRTVQIGVEFEQLYKILDGCGDKGAYIKNLVKEKLQSEVCGNPEVIDLENFTGNIFICNSLLEITRALYQNENGKYAEENNGLFMLDEIVH